MPRILIEAFTEILIICEQQCNNFFNLFGFPLPPNADAVVRHNRIENHVPPQIRLTAARAQTVLQFLCDVSENNQGVFCTHISRSGIGIPLIDALPRLVRLIRQMFTLTNEQTQALTIIENFLANNANLVFIQLSKRLIALQLVVRVLDPKRIEQNSHPLCGPVILMQAFAENSPDDYVNYVVGLCLHRTADITIRLGHVLQIRVDAGARLLTRAPTYNEIPQADYVALASLRYSTAYLHYEQQFTIRLLQGATTDGEFMQWLAQAGYQNVADHTITRLRGLAPWAARIRGQQYADRIGMRVIGNNVALARNLLNQGHIIFGCIAHPLAEHVVYNNPGPGPGIKDIIIDKAMIIFGGHWVIVKHIEFRANGIEFTICTWGRERTAIIDESKAGSWWRGFISGQP